MPIYPNFLRGGQRAHPLHGLVMVDGFEMIAQRLAGDGNAVLDDFGGLAKGERVSLDRVGRVSQLDVVVFLELRQGGPRRRAQPIELRLFLFNIVDEGRQHADIISRDAT
jgi:hypothetical protein